MRNLTAIDRCRLAGAAYEQDLVTCSKRVTSILGRCEVVPFYIRKTDTEAYLVRLANRIIVMFAGTESIKDLTLDAWFCPKKYRRGGHIHGGFLKIHDEMEQDFKDLIRYNLPGVEKLDIIGHSLGGAVSLLAADMVHDIIPLLPLSVTTFGCPNGWSRGAREKFNQRHHRYNILHYRNYRDPVCWLMSLTSGKPGSTVWTRGTGHGLHRYLMGIKGV